MNNKIAVILLLCWFIDARCLASVSAQTLSSQELINNAKQLDGKNITYRGEAVGEIMIRGDRAWVHLNDGYITVSIWAKKNDLNIISHLGDYRTKGDEIEVDGIIYRSCLEHGGDLDIHADKVKMISSGGKLAIGINEKKIEIALILSLIVLAILIIRKVDIAWQKSL